MSKLATPATQLQRFEPRARRVKLEALHQRGPRLVTCWFTGEDLRDFVSPAGGDHVKLQVPGADGVLVAEQLDPETGRLLNKDVLGLRDMTPRAVDNDDCRVRIDIVAHDDGVVGQWLQRAQPGDECILRGPRGSRQVTEELDRFIAVVDASALPAAERRLAEMGLVGALHLLGGDGIEAIDLPEGVELVHHETAAPNDWREVAAAIAARIPADQRTLVWAAGEAHGVSQVRAAVREVACEGLFGQFNGYWQAGVAEYDHHAELPEPAA